jgi:hypothetical protein
MSTQLDSSPAFSSDVGTAIELAEGLAAALGASLAAEDWDGTALGEDTALGDAAALAPAPLVHADATSPTTATIDRRRL